MYISIKSHTTCRSKTTFTGLIDLFERLFEERQLSVVECPVVLLQDYRTEEIFVDSVRLSLYYYHIR